MNEPCIAPRGNLVGYAVGFIGVTILGLTAGIVGYGGLSKQVEINTGRMDRAERHIESLRDDDADAKAQVKSLERRLQRLENIHPETNK